MFEQAQQSTAHDDRQSQRGLILAYALWLPLLAYGFTRVVKHWHTPGYDHGLSLASVLLLTVSAIANIVTRLVRLGKLKS